MGQSTYNGNENYSIGRTKAKAEILGVLKLNKSVEKWDIGRGGTRGQVLCPRIPPVSWLIIKGEAQKAFA